MTTNYTGASVRVYYVDGEDGDDTNTDVQAQTFATAWQTVQHAMDRVAHADSDSPDDSTGGSSEDADAKRNDDDDDILGAAAREVLEETGYRSTDHRRVYTYYPSIGISNQVFHVVFCKAAGLVGTPDEDEVSFARWASPAEVRGLIRSGEMMDGYSLTALLLWFSDVPREAASSI